MNNIKNSRDFGRSPLRIFLSYFRAHYKLFVLDLSCALVVSLIDLAFPLVARHAMYEMLPNNMYRTFYTVMIIVGVSFVLRSGLSYVITYWGHMFGVRVEADMREDLFEHIQSLDFAFFDRNRTGQLMNRITGDLFELTELAHHGPEDLFISLITIGGALGIMFNIQWRLALVILIIIPIFLTVVMLCRKRMSITSRKVKERMAEINGEIEAGLSGIRVSKAFANEQIDLNKFKTSNDKFKTSKCDNYRAFGQFNSSLEFFMGIMPVAVMAFGGWFIMSDHMNYIDLITFYLYISTFINPIRKLSNFAETFMNGFAGLNRFVTIMRTKPNIAEPLRPSNLGRAKGDIQIKNVYFKYGEDSNVLEGVNLNINNGQTIGVVGPSGGGKSTLCQLIPRFYDVDSGEILIDGVNIKNVPKGELRRNIGIVQQDVFLFADTVYNNIAYGKPGASKEEVEQAARMAEIYDDIKEMPNGMDTYVGERGVLLSGGQKQRISIARIFLKNPPILILDEATSALDTITEARIQRAFDKLAEGRTTIIIAHRLSTVRNADKLILINKGRIEEEGTPEELLQSDGSYAKLYRSSILSNSDL